MFIVYGQTPIIEGNFPVLLLLYGRVTRVTSFISNENFKTTYFGCIHKL